MSRFLKDRYLKIACDQELVTLSRSINPELISTSSHVTCTLYFRTSRIWNVLYLSNIYSNSHSSIVCHTRQAEKDGRSFLSLSLILTAQHPRSVFRLSFSFSNNLSRSHAVLVSVTCMRSLGACRSSLSHALFPTWSTHYNEFHPPTFYL